MAEESGNWEPRYITLLSWSFSLLALMIAIVSILSTSKSIIISFFVIIIAAVVIFLTFLMAQKYGYRIFCSQNGRLSLLDRMIKYTCEKALSMRGQYIVDQMKLADRLSNTEIIETEIEKELVANYLQVTNAIKSGLRNSIKSSPSYHNDKLSELLLSVDALTKFNLFKIWFMPTFPGHRCTFHEKMMEDFQKLSLREWNYFTIGLQGGASQGRGILDQTEYVFITWDLTRIEEWQQESKLNTLDGLLNKLKERTHNGQMFVARVLILPDDILQNRDKLKILVNIWCKYFYRRNKGLYKIYSVFETDFTDIDENDIQLFKDIAIFSNSEQRKKAAQVNPQSILGNVDDYMVIQFSTKISTENVNPFLLLFAIENPSCHNSETNKVIKLGFDQRFNIVKNMWNDIISAKLNPDVEKKVENECRKKNKKGGSTMIENKSKEGIQQEEVVELLNQGDPFYGIYMVYDMYGPLPESKDDDLGGSE